MLSFSSSILCEIAWNVPCWNWRKEMLTSLLMIVGTYFFSIDLGPVPIHDQWGGNKEFGRKFAKKESDATMRKTKTSCQSFECAIWYYEAKLHLWTNERKCTLKRTWSRWISMQCKCTRYSRRNQFGPNWRMPKILAYNHAYAIWLQGRLRFPDIARILGVINLCFPSSTINYFALQILLDWW